jgi:hypothetical protein
VVRSRVLGTCELRSALIDGKYRYVHTLSVNLNPNAPSTQADDNGGIIR